jgi:hypothetical protein
VHSDVISTILFFVAYLVVFMYIVAPVVARRKVTFAAQPAVELIAADDPRVPPSARAFFADVGADLQESGFALKAQMLDAHTVPNTTGYVAVFENGATRDLAAAMAIFSRAGATPIRHNFVVEFCTEYADRSSANTNNARQPSPFPPAPWRTVWGFPAMADLAQLYEIHRALTAPRVGEARRVVPPGSDHATRLRDGMVRDFETQQRAGYLYLDATGQVFRKTWKGAYLMVWGILWPVGAIRRWLLKRRARAILCELNLPVTYATVNPARWVAQGDAGLAPTFTVPAAAAQSASASNEPPIIAEVVRHSGLGIASFVMAIALGVAQVALLSVGVALTSHPSDQEHPPLGLALIALGFLAGCVLNLVGLVLGIVGLVQRDRRRGFAVAGTCLNALVLLAAGTLVLLAR